jgi:hypothetical protein
MKGIKVAKVVFKISLTLLILLAISAICMTTDLGYIFLVPFVFLLYSSPIWFGLIIFSGIYWFVNRNKQF